MEDQPEASVSSLEGARVKSTGEKAQKEAARQ